MTITPDYRVIISKNATESEKYAAELFCRYIFLSTEKEFPVLSDSEPETKKEIVIGKTNREKKGKFDRNVMGPEGYRILCDKERVFLVGGGDRGILYAVLQFLEDYSGCRFFTKNCEKIVKNSSIKLPETLDMFYRPPFEMRDLFFACENDAATALRHRINRSHFNIRYIPENFGGSLRFAGYYAHTLGELTETGYNGPGPCMSSEKTFEIVMKNLYKRLADNPGGDYVCIAENDDFRYCRCPECEKTAKEEGGWSGVLLRFVNKCAAALEKDFPALKVLTYAYQHTRTPPKKERPRKNVCVMVCSIDCCFSHSFEACDTPSPAPWMEIDNNRNFQIDLKEWSEICDNIYVWDYVINFHHYLTPFPNFNNLRANMNFLHKCKVKGVFIQGLSNLERDLGYGEFGELRAYVLSKLAFKPDMDVEEFAVHYFEFMEYFYGEGFYYIKRYIDKVNESAKDNHINIYSHPLKIIPPQKAAEFIDFGNYCFDRAIELADEKQKRNLERARLQVTYYEQIYYHAQKYLNGTPEQKKAYIEKNKAFYEQLCANNIFMNPDSRLPAAPDFTSPPDLWHKLG